MNKYLLCRPEGGLNDIFRQISRCINYCLLHGRILVIDTESTETFASPFRDYFSLLIKGLTVRLDTDEFLDFAETNQLSIYPPCVKLRYGTDRPYYKDRSENYCLDGASLTFDFKSEYSENILVHHQCGGGTPSDLLLNGLRLSPWLADRFRERWLSLLKPYVGIHIRDTDMKSSYEFLLPLIQRCPQVIFLATDSAAVQKRARQSRPSGLFMSEIPDYGGLPIHSHSVTPEEKQRVNSTAVIDLLILALAKKVHISTNRSGYSKLARRLNRKPIRVLRWFVGEEWGFRLRLRLHVIRNQFFP
jgi:hypothetical protein